MPLDAPSRGSIVRQDEHAPDGHGLPAALAGNGRPNPRLAMDTGQGRLDVRHDGLDLDHEQDARDRVPRKDVDRAALARDLEGHLRECDSALDGKQTEHLLDHPGVIAIEQTIELLALPQDPNR